MPFKSKNHLRNLERFSIVCRKKKNNHAEIVNSICFPLVEKVALVLLPKHGVNQCKTEVNANHFRRTLEYCSGIFFFLSVIWENVKPKNFNYFFVLIHSGSRRCRVYSLAFSCIFFFLKQQCILYSIFADNPLDAISQKLD